jgi:hypothetical protein
MTTTEFAYRKGLASSPIIEGSNPTLFHFARSLVKRAYEHASPRIEIEDWENEEDGEAQVKIEDSNKD